MEMDFFYFVYESILFSWVEKMNKLKSTFYGLHRTDDRLRSDYFLGIGELGIFCKDCFKFSSSMLLSCVYLLFFDTYL